VYSCLCSLSAAECVASRENVCHNDLVFWIDSDNIVVCMTLNILLNYIVILLRYEIYFVFPFYDNFDEHSNALHSEHVFSVVWYVLFN